MYPKLHLVFTICITLSLCLVIANESHSAGKLTAVGGWKGQDSYRIPVSWCAVHGSAAADNPNIPNPEGGDADQTTDNVLSRRHERTTDSIYIDDVGLSFRSAINDAVHTTLSFPKIDDPVIESPLWKGNLWLYDDQEDPAMNEINRMLHSCLLSWVDMTGGTGAVYGIPTININRFINESRTDIIKDVIGSSLCTDLAPPDRICETPYDGYVFVIDNYYTAPLATGWKNNDPYDQNLGHEFGHSLVLAHRLSMADPTALMNWKQVTTTSEEGKEYVSNIELSPQEKTTVRDNAFRIRGVETDPEGTVLPADVLESIEMDEIQETNSSRPFEDISYVRAILDNKNNSTYFMQNLFGYIPEMVKTTNQSNLQYWILVDLDNDTSTGGNQSALDSLGIPSTDFEGTDLVFLSEPAGMGNLTNATGAAWRIVNDSSKALTLDNQSARVELRTALLELHYSNTAVDQLSGIAGRPVYDSITAILNDTGDRVEVDKPFSIQAIITSNGTVVDTLRNTMDSERPTLILTKPLYPQCFVDETVHPEQDTTVVTSDLPPNESINVFLGPREVATGTTASSGNSTIHFTIPNQTSSGLHMITVGVNGTALAAVCEIHVQGI